MITQSKKTTDENHIISSAKNFLTERLNWLSPSASLHSTGGRDFGRSIELSLNEVAKGEVKRLQLRKRDTAVVMSIAHYEEIVHMKEMYAALVERVQKQEIAEASDAYELLYQRITSSESRQAADSLFSASDDDLRKSYQSGETETK